MATRIRYVKDSEGRLVSKSPIVVGGDMLVITIAPDKLLYTITEANSGKVVCSSNATSMQMLKINVKKELRSRGAVFNDEVRSRSPE
jgi:hypothetical protein